MLRDRNEKRARTALTIEINNGKHKQNVTQSRA